MATNLKFPMTLRMSAARLAGILALAAAFVGFSFYLFGADGTMRVPFYGQAPKHDVSYFFFLLGVAIAFGVVQAFISGRPALVLNTDGFVFKPVFGAARGLAWSDVVELTSHSSKYESCVVVRTRAGQVQKIPAFRGSPEEMRYVMRTCAEVAAKARKDSKGAISAADRS